MKRPISTSFAPNMEKDDALLAYSLFAKTLVGASPKEARKELRNKLKAYYNSTNAHLFASARSGLYYSLKALNFKKGDEVIVQAFTCVAVPSAVTWAGLTPVFVDANKKTYNIDIDDLKKRITSKTKAIIVQHTFGIPGPIKKLQNIAKKQNIVLIEDCAHTIGGTLDDKKLGTFGDIAVFSFGRDKALSSVFGGAVIAKDKDVSKTLHEFEGTLTPAPNNFALQQLLYLVIYAISLPLYNIVVGKAILWLSAKIGFLSKAVYKEECKGSMPHFISYSFHPALCKLVLSQFEKVDRYNKHRQTISQDYIRDLELELDTSHTYARVPVLVSDKSAFLREAKNNGLYLDSWYRTAVDPPGTNLEAFNYDSRPVAEEIARHVVNLPTNINTSAIDAEKVIHFVQKHRG